MSISITIRNTTIGLDGLCLYIESPLFDAWIGGPRRYGFINRTVEA